VLLIAFEVGLSTMLLVVAGLFMNSFVRLLDVNTGFRTQHGVSAQINLPGANYKSDEAVQLFYEKLLNSMEHRPGIAEAGLVSHLPLEGQMWNDDLSRPGDPRPVSSRPWTNVRFISGSYFAAMGVPLLEGRTFRNRAGERKDVVVVSNTVAKQLWPKENPVGQPVIVNGQSFAVIGVAGDTRAEMDKVAPLMVYVPYWASNIGSVSQYSVVLSTSLPPHDAVTLLRQTVSSLDRGVAISKVRSFDQIVADSVAPRRFQLTLVSLFAIAALLVAALGIFGIVAGLVAARRSEIGIRMALGATSAGIAKMVLRQGLFPVFLGLGAGIAGAIAFGSALRSLLYEVSPTDPFTLCAVALTLIAVAALACWIPARRAARIDPMEALHYQ